MSKMQNLQKELNRTTGKTTAADPTLELPSLPTNLAASRPPSRVGQFNLSSWQPQAFKHSLRLVQARKDATMQQLVAEALNDLFVKYSVPTVNED